MASHLKKGSSMARNTTNEKETRWKGAMWRLTDSLRRRLQTYPDLGDEYVKQQLEKHNKGDYYFPGVSKAILNKHVGTEASYTRNPAHQEFLTKPENQAISTRIAKRHGEPYITQVSHLRPDQQELSNQIVEQAQRILPEQYAKIGQQVPLEQPVNDIMQQLLQRYQQGTLGNEYLSGINGVFPGLQQNLQGLGQGAQQLGQAAYGAGQNAYNAINPYLQQAAAQGQSYLSAAQPYAKRAANLGGDILEGIRQPAINAGRQGIEGLGNLLSMLKGRV